MSQNDLNNNVVNLIVSTMKNTPDDWTQTPCLEDFSYSVIQFTHTSGVHVSHNDKKLITEVFYLTESGDVNEGGEPIGHRNAISMTMSEADLLIEAIQELCKVKENRQSDHNRRVIANMIRDGFKKPNR